MKEINIIEKTKSREMINAFHKKFPEYSKRSFSFKLKDLHSIIPLGADGIRIFPVLRNGEESLLVIPIDDNGDDYIDPAMHTMDGGTTGNFDLTPNPCPDLCGKSPDNI